MVKTFKEIRTAPYSASRLSKEHDNHAEMHKKTAKGIRKEGEEEGDHEYKHWQNKLADKHDHAATQHKKASIMLSKNHKDAYKQSSTAHSVTGKLFKSQDAVPSTAARHSMTHKAAVRDYHDLSRNRSK